MTDQPDPKKERRRGHNEGTAYERSDGRWEWKITLADGGRKSFYGASRKIAKRKADDYQRELEDGLDPDSAKVTVSAFLDDWLKRTAAQRVRPSTLESYRGHINHHIKPAIGGKTLRELSVQDVNGMLTRILAVQVPVATGLTKQKTSATTANLIRATLRAALNDALKQGYVRRNVAALADPRQTRKKKVQPIEPDEMVRFLELTKNDRHGMLYVLAVHTGFRQGELLALTWDDFDRSAGILHARHTVTKVDGKRTRTAPKTEESERAIHLSAQAIDALYEQQIRIEEWRMLAGSRWQENNLIFPSTIGTFLRSSNVTHHFQDLLAEHGYPRIRFHELRHAYASYVLANGGDIFEVKTLLGHSQIALTANLYGHLTKRLSEDAAVRIGEALKRSDDN